MFDRRVYIASAAAFAVVADGHLKKRRPPQASTAGLRAVRELAAFVLVLVKAVEGVADVLAHQRVQAAPAKVKWSHRNYGFDEDERLTAPSRLWAVPRLADNSGIDHRFDVAGQVVAAGTRTFLFRTSPNCLVLALGNWAFGSEGSWSTSPREALASFVDP
jgi:hypothetical protein